MTEHEREGVNSAERLRARLTELSAAVAQLPSLSTPPETTLAILGEARTEAHWEAFLTYFLDPRGDHGFGTDVLEAFLSALAGHSTCTLDPPAYQLTEVQLRSQIGADDGVPDILLWVPNEWFCCIELKAHSGESDDQTIRYANSTTLGPLTVADFPDEACHYVYLAPATKPDPASQTFTRVAWEDVVPALSDVVATARGRYPAKSHAQLSDFVDTLRDELVMTEHSQYEREKVALAVEYGPEIDTVQTALEAFVEDELTNWQADFDAAAPDEWDTELGGRIFPRMIHHQWQRDRTGAVTSDDEAGITMIYESQIDKASLLNGDLSIVLQRRTGSDAELEEQIYDALYTADIQAEFSALADEHDLTLFDRGGGVQILETPVPLDIERGDTIGEQFATRIRELQPVTEVVHQVFEDLEW